jgi:hypothetical protein
LDVFRSERRDGQGCTLGASVGLAGGQAVERPADFYATTELVVGAVDDREMNTESTVSAPNARRYR